MYMWGPSKDRIMQKHGTPPKLGMRCARDQIAATPQLCGPAQWSQPRHRTTTPDINDYYNTQRLVNVPGPQLPAQSRPSSAQVRESKVQQVDGPGDRLKPKIRTMGDMSASSVLGSGGRVVNFDHMLARDSKIAGKPPPSEYKGSQLPPEALAAWEKEQNRLQLLQVEGILKDQGIRLD